MATANIDLRSSNNFEIHCKKNQIMLIICFKLSIMKENTYFNGEKRENSGWCG